MTKTKAVTSRWLNLIDSHSFAELFIEELGWNRPDQKSVNLIVDGQPFRVDNVASYKGIRVFLCMERPSSRVQRLIDAKVQKTSTERLVVFDDGKRQDWRWPQSLDPSGRGTPRLITHEHHIGARTEALVQRLQQIELSLTEQPTVVSMLERMHAAFDAERVTKSFFKAFTKQRNDLVSRISGQLSEEDRDWYGSLLMNRLMFIYFIQRKGFMDDDLDYLRSRLVRVQAMGGKDRFYEFYRDLLIPLFHDSLGSPSRTKLDPKIASIIGNVPYVNGGIFAPQNVEAAQYALSIPDDAFEAIFDLFDSYQWHLDDRPAGNPNEINPAVLGYIFEQFINQRSENEQEAAKGSDKGAYYTAEDISRYMTSSSLVPVFLDRFERQSGLDIWSKVQTDGSRYIWTSLAYGQNESEPPFEASRFSEKAPEGSALKGETWWERFDRLNYLDHLGLELRNGTIRSADDAVARNLDLETIALDTLDSIDSPEQALCAWHILSGLRIIDPTCGSGAFLFAALRILHALYEGAIDAARQFRDQGNGDLDRLLESVDRHANQEYFILKHATLHNLYGVDIMPEATEIARLRLFLRLVAAVDTKDQLEPLPDLDFNIKSGNAVVGAVRVQDISTTSSQLDSHLLADDVISATSRVARSYLNFQAAQEDGATSAIEEARASLREELQMVRSRVDRQWHRATSNIPYQAWRDSHEPLHWFLEFPEPMSAGGFDVVIGNPPYVSRSAVAYSYRGFKTDKVPDVYGAVLERSTQISHSSGRLSMIVPLNLTWGPKYNTVRDVLTSRFSKLWVSTYGIIPARLFPGLEIRNTIILASSEHQMDRAGVALSMYSKWNSEYRPHLFSTLRYTELQYGLKMWPKCGHGSLRPLASPVSEVKRLGDAMSSTPTSYRVGFKKIGGYSLSVFRTDPPAMDGNRRPVPQKVVGNLYFRSELDAQVGLAIAASRSALMWWVFTGDEFNVPARTFESFPLSISMLSDRDKGSLEQLGEQLHHELSVPGEHLLWTPYAGAWQGTYDLNRMRHITEKVDEILSPYLGISGEKERQDFEIEYWNFMKFGRERPGTVRGAQPDRDR